MKRWTCTLILAGLLFPAIVSAEEYQTHFESDVSPSNILAISPIDGSADGSASYSEVAMASVLADSLLEEASCDQCGGGNSCDCGRPSWLPGLIAPSETCFHGFISPMTNPVFFEDPRTLTELRFMFINQKMPLAVGGDNFQLYAMQIRAALTDRLSIVASKDGFIIADSPLLDDGWGDLAAGLKYNLYADVCRQQLLSAGFSFKLPIGSTRSLQGNGDGEFHLYLSGAADLGCGWRWMSGTGFQLPVDTVDESQVWYWSNHLSKEIGCGFYVLGEVNWYHWMRSGGGGIAGVEGGDLVNLGSTGVAGNDIVTGAIGLKYKPHDLVEIGVAWEAPLTERRDILDNRLSIDWIIRY